MRKFLSKESINRVILLSDGQANVGPNSPEALAELGSSLIKEGISVTTIGLGTEWCWIPNLGVSSVFAVYIIFSRRCCEGVLKQDVGLWSSWTNH